MPRFYRDCLSPPSSPPGLCPHGSPRESTPDLSSGRRVYCLNPFLLTIQNVKSCNKMYVLLTLQEEPCGIFQTEMRPFAQSSPRRQSERKPAPDWVGNGRDCRYVGKTAFSWVLPPAPPFHVCNNMWRGRKLPCVLPIKAVLKIECLGRYAQRPTVLGPLFV